MPYSELMGLVVLESFPVAVPDSPEVLFVPDFSFEQADNQTLPVTPIIKRNFFIAYRINERKTLIDS